MQQTHNDTTQENPPAPDAETAPTRRGSVWVAETFSIAAVILSWAGLAGTRLVSTLGSATATGTQLAAQLGAIKRVIIGDGATGLLAVGLAALALVTTTTDTRPWARWLAAAALVVGAIGVIVSGVTFALLPEPQPQPMMPSPR